MPQPLEADILTLTSLGGDAVRDRYEEFASCLVRILEVNPVSINDIDKYKAAISHGFSYYYWKWDPRSVSLYKVTTAAIARWEADAGPSIDVMCELVDFVFFLVWCSEESNIRQSERLLEPLRVASTKFAKSAPRRNLPRPARKGPYRVAWLGMYVQSDNPMSTALHQIAPALLASGHQLDVYAWRFCDDAFRSNLEAMGARVHELAQSTPLETILAIEARSLQDQPDIAISDMNNGIPTALFSRRLAPVQIFLQAGMPAWPVQHLDAVFNSFGFDPQKAGWGDAQMLRTNAPWDGAALDPAVAETEIAAERALLPCGTRLIGSYGRFSKITLPYLEAAEKILLRCPDVGFVLGGTGDAAHIRSFITNSAAGSRITVEERYVSGHVWGHILELMLDTWPVTAGIAAREMLAKSKPVVTLHSEEMPAMDLQRDPALVARTWEGFVDMAVHLLQNNEAYGKASVRAGALVRRLSEIRTFEHELDEDIERTVQCVRSKRSFIGRLNSMVNGVASYKRK
ncbi:conserved hypothetical protein [Bosea sp. 62]|uniref:hypothetical protein n=1 Tax=unclassified Bosea (in: a-proteobacteria) TaxID=2653178 RepID=UPI001257D379|nr:MULTISPECIES: hypothetical protein [unclassified Bosea (in: a-proteobacteria)]CAD5285552.1 conserved hypothetical protein [Bosea sp. 21B]CAD5288229.1 conserved hypothetical protein [Bosea sp. 46]CAD5301464.1 conserved hypothetical protein [Bosea sp. 7B]VVT51066.1 conserved hypothetical protein [Bosea sp. EC-HK365B]VXB08683.1 conserved hypothetical protein [Bosea sp. 62]